MGSYSRVLFHQAVTVTGPRGPKVGCAYPVSGSPWEG
jgi:hypothetical protein